MGCLADSGPLDHRSLDRRAVARSGHGHRRTRRTTGRHALPVGVAGGGTDPLRGRPRPPTTRAPQHRHGGSTPHHRRRGGHVPDRLVRGPGGVRHLEPGRHRARRRPRGDRPHGGRSTPSLRATSGNNRPDPASRGRADRPDRCHRGADRVRDRPHRCTRRGGRNDRGRRPADHRGRRRHRTGGGHRAGHRPSPLPDPRSAHGPGHVCLRGRVIRGDQRGPGGSRPAHRDRDGHVPGSDARVRRSARSSSSTRAFARC